VTELTVRSGSNWQSILAQITRHSGDATNSGSGSSRQRMSERLTFSTSDDPATILAACRDNIITLWNDSVLRGVLRRRSIDLTHSSGL
jgi:guanine nucleotide-binding protein alpha-1 subunit